MRRPIKIPRESFDNYVLMDAKRPYPSLDCLTKKTLDSLDSRVRKLMEFEDVGRTPFQAVDYLEGWVSGGPRFRKKNINESPGNSRKQKLYFVDPWEGNSMIIVKEGRLPISEGFNMIVTHSDSPHVRVKPKAVRLEWSEDKVFHHPGLRLSGILKGGGVTHQWVGQQVDVVGYVCTSKGKRPLSFPGDIGDYSGHVDNRDEEEVREAFQREKLVEVVTGHSSVAEFLKRLELESLDELGQVVLYAVPRNAPLAIDEYNWRLLAAYRHDDLSCTYSAVDALIRAKNPKLTSVVWVSDLEEVGDRGPSGVEGSFFDHVLDYLLERNYNRNGVEVSERGRRLLLHRSSVIIGDVSVAPYGADADNMDVASAPKLGLGTYILADDFETSHADFVRKLRGLALEGGGKRMNICHQVAGNFYDQDQMDCWLHSFEGKAHLLSRVGQYGWVGIPCASTHSHNEKICPGDEYWTSRFYRKFLESDIGFSGG